MKFSFKARIYKVGINPVVQVPARITKKLTASQGFIPVKGMIGNFFFQQTLCPVKDEPYRLHVNAVMLKGSGLRLGDTATFTIEQDSLSRNRDVPMNKAFEKRLKKEKLLDQFLALNFSRRKEVLRYLNNLKSAEALDRNIEKMVAVLRGQAESPLLRKTSSTSRRDPPVK